MKSNTIEEAAAISFFVNVVGQYTPGTTLTEADCAAIKAAQLRIQRQIESANSASKWAGRKPLKKPSKVALYQRKRRARLKEAK